MCRRQMISELFAEYNSVRCTQRILQIVKSRILGLFSDDSELFRRLYRGCPSFVTVDVDTGETSDEFDLPMVYGCLYNRCLSWF